MKHVVLFDLDGTLTDPKEGITKSVQYALSKFDIHIPDLDVLIPFIGPPLKTTFMEDYHFSEAQAERAIFYYRERFQTVGLYENHLFDGVIGMLEALQRKGVRLAIATSKPTVFAIEIANHFQFAHYFEYIVGSELDGTRSAKSEVIAEALRLLDVSPEDCYMVGDRKHDMLGAAENHVESIGVTFGYGSHEELASAQANHIVHTLTALKDIIL